MFETDAPLAIRLFGPFEVRLHGEPLPRLRTRKGQWLLALLALRPGQEVERSWLAGTLWPESNEPQAFGSLRKSLADLRAALGEAGRGSRALAAERTAAGAGPRARFDAQRQRRGPGPGGRLLSPTVHTLSLEPTGVEIDVTAFDGAIARGEGASLEEAVGLYRGPLLEACSEEWVFQERQVREQAYLGALERLAGVAMERGDPTAAERHLRLAVGVDPLRESTQRARMAALAAGGNYAAALLAYRELRLLLHRELNAEPDPETTALFQQIRRNASARRVEFEAHVPSPVTSPQMPPTPAEASSPPPGVPTGLIRRAAPASGRDILPLRPPREAQSRRAAGPVALLYKRHAEPDETVLRLLERELAAQGFEVFVDRHLTVGIEWAQEIERQLRGAYAVVPLLSAASVASEMLQYELQIAHEAAQRQGGKPRLLPVRIRYPDPLPEPLASILAPLQHAVWEGPEADGPLVTGLVRALEAPTGASPAAMRERLEPVGGAVPLDSAFYVVRPADEEFRAAIARRDSIVLVKGARQMGKTSLLARGLHQARKAGARVLRTDFQTLNASHLETLNDLFLKLAGSIADQLELETDPEEEWHPRRGPSDNFKRYWQRVVLCSTEAPIVWGLDEVDRLFGCDFATEVFGLFRSWHNDRALDPEGPWHRLTLAIAYATEHHLFITDINQSPFNVGTRVALEEFTVEQVADLNERYGSPLRDDAELTRYMELVGGQPYLVRRGLHQMVMQDLDLSTLEAQADRDEGVFGDHLRRMLVVLARNPDLCDAVREVLQGRPCPTEESFYRLRSAGVVAGDSARHVRPRGQLYASYLARHLL